LDLCVNCLSPAVSNDLLLGTTLPDSEFAVKRSFSEVTFSTYIKQVIFYFRPLM